MPMTLFTVPVVHLDLTEAEMTPAELVEWLTKLFDMCDTPGECHLLKQELARLNTGWGDGGHPLGFAAWDRCNMLMKLTPPLPLQPPLSEAIGGLSEQSAAEDLAPITYKE